MRRILALLIMAGFAAAAARAEVELVRVWPQWQDANAFERIGEYFGRGENDGREIVVRTHVDRRAGLYFLVRTKAGAAVANARFVIAIVRPDSPDPKTFTFPASIPAKSQVFLLGLTGDDWPGGREVHPVAWRVTIVDAANQVIASAQSFLWALPEGEK